MEGVDRHALFNTLPLIINSGLVAGRSEEPSKRFSVESSMDVDALATQRLPRHESRSATITERQSPTLGGGGRNTAVSIAGGHDHGAQMIHQVSSPRRRTAMLEQTKVQEAG